VQRNVLCDLFLGVYGFQDYVSMLTRSLAAVNCYSSANRTFPREKAVGNLSNNEIHLHDVVFRQ